MRSKKDEVENMREKIFEEKVVDNMMEKINVKEKKV